MIEIVAFYVLCGAPRRLLGAFSSGRYKPEI